MHPPCIFLPKKNCLFISLHPNDTPTGVRKEKKIRAVRAHTHLFKILNTPLIMSYPIHFVLSYPINPFYLILSYSILS